MRNKGADFNAVLRTVIETHLTLRGKGVEDDPVRRITQYWSLDGELLAEAPDRWLEDSE